MDNNFPYRHILDMPHHVSKKRPQMPRINRAAQFSPFAALTGHDEAIKETARLTEEEIEIDEYRKEEVNRTLNYIKDNINEGIDVVITYFIPDEKKDGGRYAMLSGKAVKLKEYEGVIVLKGDKEIPIARILRIDVDK